MTLLHSFGEALRQLLQVIPLSWVRLLFVGTLVVVLLWVVRLPRSETTPAEGATRWDENLKFGAGLALIIQILIYSFV